MSLVESEQQLPPVKPKKKTKDTKNVPVYLTLVIKSFKQVTGSSDINVNVTFVQRIDDDADLDEFFDYRVNDCDIRIPEDEKAIPEKGKSRKHTLRTALPLEVFTTFAFYPYHIEAGDLVIELTSKDNYRADLCINYMEPCNNLTVKKSERLDQMTSLDFLGPNARPEVTFQCDVKRDKKHQIVEKYCAHIKIRFFLTVPAWKQFLKMTMPILLLNIFMISLMLVETDDGTYLGIAITIALTMAVLIDNDDVTEYRFEFGTRDFVRILMYTGMGFLSFNRQTVKLIGVILSLSGIFFPVVGYVFYRMEKRHIMKRCLKFAHITKPKTNHSWKDGTIRGSWLHEKSEQIKALEKFRRIVVASSEDKAPEKQSKTDNDLQDRRDESSRLYLFLEHIITIALCRRRNAEYALHAEAEKLSAIMQEKMGPISLNEEPTATII